MIPATLWITLAKMLKITAEASQTNDQLKEDWQTELKQSEQIQDRVYLNKCQDRVYFSSFIIHLKLRIFLNVFYNVDTLAKKIKGK